MLAQLFEHLFRSIDSMFVTNFFIWAVVFIFFLPGGVTTKTFTVNLGSMLQHSWEH